MIPDDDETGTILASADNISPGRMANTGSGSGGTRALYDVPVEFLALLGTAAMTSI